MDIQFLRFLILFTLLTTSSCFSPQSSATEKVITNSSLNAPQTFSIAQQKVLSDRALCALLAPIALFPDSVLSHILIASTYPLEVVEAERWLLKEGKNLSGTKAINAVENKEWDPSIKSLVAFPDVLIQMSADLDWTLALGDSFLANEPKVLNNIQRLRQKALQAGSFKKMKHLHVTQKDKSILIRFSNPKKIGLPFYNTLRVYGVWWIAEFPPINWVDPNQKEIISAGSASHYGSLDNSFYSNDINWDQREIIIVHHYEYLYPNYSYNNHDHKHGGHKWHHDLDRGQKFNTREHGSRDYIDSHRGTNRFYENNGRNPKNRIEPQHRDKHNDLYNKYPRNGNPRSSRSYSSNRSNDEPRDSQRSHDSRFSSDPYSSRAHSSLASLSYSSETQHYESSQDSNSRSNDRFNDSANRPWRHLPQDERQIDSFSSNSAAYIPESHSRPLRQQQLHDNARRDGARGLNEGASSLNEGAQGFRRMTSYSSSNAGNNSVENFTPVTPNRIDAIPDADIRNRELREQEERERAQHEQQTQEANARVMRERAARDNQIAEETQRRTLQEHLDNEQRMQAQAEDHNHENNLREGIEHERVIREHVTRNQNFHQEGLHTETLRQEQTTHEQEERDRLETEKQTQHEQEERGKQIQFQRAQIELERANRERAELERQAQSQSEQEGRMRAEQERQAQAQLANEELERTNQEIAAREKQTQAQREQEEREQEEHERTNRESLEREKQAQAQREQEERERANRENLEREKQAQAQREQEEREQANRENLEREKQAQAQREQAEREQANRETAEREKQAEAQREKEAREKDDRDREEHERLEREK